MFLAPWIPENSCFIITPDAEADPGFSEWGGGGSQAKGAPFLNWFIYAGKIHKTKDGPLLDLFTNSVRVCVHLDFEATLTQKHQQPTMGLTGDVNASAKMAFGAIAALALSFLQSGNICKRQRKCEDHMWTTKGRRRQVTLSSALDPPTYQMP